MGFLKKIGSFTGLFGGDSRSLVEDKGSLSRPSRRRPPTQPAPVPSQRPNINDLFEQERAKMRENIGKMFQSDLSHEEIRLAQTFGKLPTEEKEFLLGKATNVVSSNVESIQYIWDEETLFIIFKNGGMYQYWQISPQEAKSFYEAGSKGKWVWDKLRVRGTVYGFQKPYAYLSASAFRSPAGGKAYEPKWHKSDRWRRQHGAIPESGEVPPGWSETGPGGNNPRRGDMGG